MTVRKPRRGYTLIEMVLVLAIIVLVASMAYPSLDGMYADLKVQAAADEVRGQCIQARTQAVNEGRPYALAIMPGSDRARVVPLDRGSGAGGEAGVGERKLPKGITFGQVEGAAGGGGDGYLNAVVFLPNGTAQADREIVLSGRNAKPLVVHVRALTGVVTVQKYLGEKGQP